MCTSFVFLSSNLYADFMLACSILEGYVYKFCVLTLIGMWPVLACSIPGGYVHECLVFRLMRKSRVKDPLGTMKDSLGSMFAKDCVSDPLGGPLGM